MTHKWDTDVLGRIVREVWVSYCEETGHTDKPAHLAAWESLDEWAREVDRRIGLAVAHYAEAELLSEVTGLRFSGGPAEWLAGRTRALQAIEKRGLRLGTWFDIALIATGALCQIAYNIAKDRGNE